MKIYKIAQEEYQGNHSPPTTKSQGSSLDDLSNTYPDDIYSNQGARFYGHYGRNHPIDQQSINIIQNARNKPNCQVKVYRAVPDINYELKQEAKEISSIIAYHNKFNFFPMNNSIIHQLETKYPYEQFSYDEQQEHILSDLQSQLTELSSQKQNKLSINPGDWVTISLQYAKEHGQSNLNNKYTVLSKIVRASELFTDGDSIHEWGYLP